MFIVSPQDPEARSSVESVISEVTKAFKETDKEIEALRHVLRIQLAGIDTARYIRFAMVVPEIGVPLDGEAEAYHGTGQYHYTIDNYDFCETFVVDSALKLGVDDFSLWMPKTWGDAKRAEEAMAANGGVLPDDWQ